MKAKALVVVLSLVFLSAWLSDLPAQNSEITAALEEAKALYVSGNFARAIARLQSVIDQLQRVGPEQASPAHLTNAYLHLGMSYLALNDADAATESFKAVLRVDPAYRLDADVYAPKVLKSFEEARAAVAKEVPVPRASVPEKQGGAIAAEESGSKLPLILVGVGGAAGAGVALSASKKSSDGEPNIQDPPDTSTGGPETPGTSAPTTTTISAQQVTACFTTTPDPPIIKEGENINLNAQCSEPSWQSITSYTWDLGDGREREEMSTNPTYRTAGTYTVSLTVRAYGQSNSTSKNIEVRPVTTTTVPTTSIYFTPMQTTHVQSSFTTFIGVGPYDGSTTGFVVVNDKSAGQANNSSPTRHVVTTSVGENSVLGYLAQGESAPGFWRFDFSADPSFRRGSIRVRQGQVLSADADSVVFRLTGAPGERVYFTVEFLP